jgi:hypothetical protein
LKDKNLQLVSYAKDGYNPLLVIDNDDIMLLDRRQVAEAFRSATPRAPCRNISDIYVADTGHGGMWFYPLRVRGRGYPDLPEIEQYVKMQVLERAKTIDQGTFR